MINNNRILVIDDNQAIHDDFRKILGRQRNATACLDDAEAVLFGNESTPTSESSFELDSAFQGQEGLERVRRANAPIFMDRLFAPLGAATYQPRAERSGVSRVAPPWDWFRYLGSPERAEQTG